MATRLTLIRGSGAGTPTQRVTPPRVPKLLRGQEPQEPIIVVQDRTMGSIQQISKAPTLAQARRDILKSGMAARFRVHYW